MENNMEIIVVENQEVEIIYTRDMMDYEINVYGTEIKWENFEDLLPWHFWTCSYKAKTERTHSR